MISPTEKVLDRAKGAAAYLRGRRGPLRPGGGATGGSIHGRTTIPKSWATAALLAAGLFATPAFADYPERDIEVIIPFSPGGGFDTFIRALIPSIQKHLPNKVNVVPVNVPGAGGRRGSTQVYRADPDGYTIGAFNMPGILIEQLKQGTGVGYDLDKMSWLAEIGVENYSLIVKGDAPYASIDDLKKLGRPVTFSATGTSSTGYIATLLSSQIVGLEASIVSGYEGSTDNVLAVIRGDTDASVINDTILPGYLANGDVKVVAHFVADSPDPKVQDANDLKAPELASINLARLVAGPPELPDDVKKVLETAIAQAVADPDFKNWLASTKNEMEYLGSADAGAQVQTMKAFYGKYADRF